MWACVDYRFICVNALAVRLHFPYDSRVINDHNLLRGGETMGYVGGVGSCAGYGMGAAAFALVLFILLVIILKAGTGIY